MRECQCNKASCETNPEHYSWIKFHRRGERTFPVCRHLSWSQFKLMIAKLPPGWRIVRVATLASSRHYLNIIQAYCQLQRPPEPVTPVEEPGTMTFTVRGSMAFWLRRLVDTLHAQFEAAHAHSLPTSPT